MVRDTVKMIGTLAFIFSLFGISDSSAQTLEIVSVSTPRLAANGFPFTYSILVRSEPEILNSIGRYVRLEAIFSDEQFTLSSRGLIGLFRIDDNRILLQYMFKVPETLPATELKFSGKFFFKNDLDIEEVYDLPARVVQTVGPWPEAIR